MKIVKVNTIMKIAIPAICFCVRNQDLENLLGFVVWQSFIVDKIHHIYNHKNVPTETEGQFFFFLLFTSLLICTITFLGSFEYGIVIGAFSRLE